MTHWGLRTLWCFWIDQHLRETEYLASSWAETAKTIMEAYADDDDDDISDDATQFIQNFMGPGGQVTSAHLLYPRNPRGGSRSQSEYDMWGNNNLGDTGI